MKDEPVAELGRCEKKLGIYLIYCEKFYRWKRRVCLGQCECKYLVKKSYS